MGWGFWFCSVMAVTYVIRDSLSLAAGKVERSWDYTHMTHTWAAAAVIIGSLK